MPWDSDDEKDMFSHDVGQEEVKRVKRGIKNVDVGHVAPRSVFLDAESNRIEDRDLNFKRQIKRNVNNYKYKTFYNVGKTRYPYLFTRNSVVIMLEEFLDVEIVVKGSYRPEELNADTDDEDALLFEVSASSLTKLQDALFKFAGLLKSTNKDMIVVTLCRFGRYAYRDGIRYNSCRIPLDIKHGMMDEFHKEIDLMSTDESVRIYIRGRSSGYVEPCFGEEADEPTYVQILATKTSTLESLENKCKEAMSRLNKDVQD